MGPHQYRTRLSLGDFLLSLKATTNSISVHATGLYENSVAFHQHDIPCSTGLVAPRAGPCGYTTRARAQVTHRAALEVVQWFKDDPLTEWHAGRPEAPPWPEAEDCKRLPPLARRILP
jgi:hypothetical protein